MSSSSEDALCKARIKSLNEFQAKDIEAGETLDLEIETERHYNHYGDRGVADLFVRESNPVSGVERDHVYEFKSDAAIEGATGANEILRQFNRMCSYFYKDEYIEPPRSRSFVSASADFELCFNATPAAFDHVMENLEIYRTISQPYVPSGLRDARSIVTFRSESNDTPCLVAVSSGMEFSRQEIAAIFEREFGIAPTSDGGDRR